MSITRLSNGLKMSRQAVTKHLRVMQKSGLARSSRHGRESIWQLDQRRLGEVRIYLDLISKLWDDALSRLRGFVED
jgi:predicted transcriptional regulator